MPLSASARAIPPSIPDLKREPTPYELHARLQFSFASLMLTIALIAVVLGVFRIVPGVGVLLAIVVAPAWIRTCIAVMRRQASQVQSLTFGEKTAIFSVSIAIVVGIGVVVVAAVVGAFATFCGFVALGGRGAEEFAVIAFVVAMGAFAVVAVIFAVFYQFWKASRQRRKY